MSIYAKNEWIDHIEDVDTGEVLQVGTLYCARLMNHMEDGIESAHSEMIAMETAVKNMQTKVKVLEDNLINNMPHNNFLEDLTTLDDINIVDGIYSPILGKVYYQKGSDWMAVGDIVTIGALQVVDSSGNTKKLQQVPSR